MKKIQDRTFIKRISESFSLANAGAQAYEVKLLCNLKSALEDICTAGEELVISKASLSFATYNSPTNGHESHHLTVIGSAHDTAFTSPTEGTLSIVDDILDGANAGDFEFRILRTITAKPVVSGLWSAQTTIDLTKITRMLAQQLARSALFATDPGFSLIGILTGKDDGTSVYITGYLEVSFVTRPRQLRLLGAEH